MSLATLLNIPALDDSRSLGEFSFSNQDQHRQIADAVMRSMGTQLNIYPLDPIPMYAIGAWLGLHQRAHDDMASALGVQNFDLSSVDFKDEQQMAAWIRLHFNSHQQAATILGIS